MRKLQATAIMGHQKIELKKKTPETQNTAEKT